MGPAIFSGMPVTALVTVLALAIGPGQVETPPPELSPHVYGGEAVDDPMELLEVVGLQVGASLCTGTVVAPDLVLTAAHCLDGAPPLPTIRVFFGNDLEEPLGGGGLAISDYGLHPEYCPEDCDTDIYDIGYVRLVNEVQLDFAEPLVDPEQYVQLVSEGTEVRIVGFGQDEEGNQGFKREVVAPIRSFSDSGAEFLAGGDGKDSCNGDSGGPALLTLPNGDRKLLGILSRGFDCGEGGIYGSPYPALCWVRDETGVDLTEGCNDCDCVPIAVGNNDDGCGCREDGRARPGMLLLAFGLLALRRRRPPRRSPQLPGRP